eukprot:33746-Pleurochrysis_carterae.AAC.1
MLSDTLAAVTACPRLTHLQAHTTDDHWLIYTLLRCEESQIRLSETLVPSAQGPPLISAEMALLHFGVRTVSCATQSLRSSRVCGSYARESAPQNDAVRLSINCRCASIHRQCSTISNYCGRQTSKNLAV